MIAGKTVLAVIPARGGSKGLPYKNIRHLGGKPLIQWTIDAAHQSAYIDRLVLSSEDPEIIDTARRGGCEVPFPRPPELARDETPGIDPLLHVMDTLVEQYDYVVVLQPTSPLRITSDIDGTINKCVSAKGDFCLSVTLAEKHPAWCFEISGDSRLLRASQEMVPSCRQDLKPAYSLNGAVYVGRSDAVRCNRGFLSASTLAYVMPRERSMDIDTEFDLALCEFILTRDVEIGHTPHIHEAKNVVGGG